MYINIGVYLYTLLVGRHCVSVYLFTENLYTLYYMIPYLCGCFLVILLT